MKTLKCPDCGKLVAVAFPLHDCKPAKPVCPICHGNGNVMVATKDPEHPLQAVPCQCKAKRYRITRQTECFVWIRWNAYGSERRGLSHRIPRSYFTENYIVLPDGLAVKRIKTLVEILK